MKGGISYLCRCRLLDISLQICTWCVVAITPQSTTTWAFISTLGLRKSNVFLFSVFVFIILLYSLNTALCAPYVTRRHFFNPLYFCQSLKAFCKTFSFVAGSAERLAQKWYFIFRLHENLEYNTKGLEEWLVYLGNKQSLFVWVEIRGILIWCMPIGGQKNKHLHYYVWITTFYSRLTNTWWTCYDWLVHRMWCSVYGVFTSYDSLSTSDLSAIHNIHDNMCTIKYMISILKWIWRWVNYLGDIHSFCRGVDIFFIIFEYEWKILAAYEINNNKSCYLCNNTTVKSTLALKTEK